MLKENINSIYEMIDSLSDEELFEPHMRKSVSYTHLCNDAKGVGPLVLAYTEMIARK